MINISCIYSFYKGNIPFNSISISNIENSTYNVELKEKIENMLFEVLPEYGNVNINEKDTLHILKVKIINYFRNPENYDEIGNIINYKYNISVDYIINDSLFSVNANDIISSEIEEFTAEDSVIKQSVKKFIDLLRGEF